MGNHILKNVKGTFDSLPNEQILKNEIINKLRDNFELYGYLPLETTILCTDDLLASKYAGGAEILKEMYTLDLIVKQDKDIKPGRLQLDVLETYPEFLEDHK